MAGPATMASRALDCSLTCSQIAAHPSTTSGWKKWKTKDGVYQLKDPEETDEALPATDDPIFADMLRDV